jgi:MFS family permease
VNLEQYYPDYKAPPSSAAGSAGAKTGFFTFIRHYPKLAAFLSFFAVHGTMTMMMAMTALALKHHGHGLSVISIAVTIHVVGMFGFSLPLGRMVDRVGRRPVMLAGMVICGAGATLVPMTPSYWTITLGIFLVGVGWSCVNVAASALIVDTTGPQERGRAIGTNDTFSAAAGIIFPLAGGPVAEYAGLPSLAFLSLALLVVPFLLVLRLREPSPGKYAEQAAAAKTA